MKSNMCVKVEFLAGTSLADTIGEAKEKASAWDVAYVTFNFNGVAFSVSRKADVLEMMNEWAVPAKKYIVG